MTDIIDSIKNGDNQTRDLKNARPRDVLIMRVLEDQDSMDPTNDDKQRVPVHTCYSKRIIHAWRAQGR
jgi:hypothetical protein